MASLFDLERKEIRKIVTYSDLNGNKQEIKIFEPSMEVQDEIREIVMQNSEAKEKGIKLNISGEIVFSKIIDKITDLEIPKDAKEEDIERVMKNPSLPLQEVMAEALDIVLSLGKIGIKFATLNASMDNIMGKDSSDIVEKVTKMIDEKQKEEKKSKSKTTKKKKKEE